MSSLVHLVDIETDLTSCLVCGMKLAEGDLRQGHAPSWSSLAHRCTKPGPTRRVFTDSGMYYHLAEAAREYGAAHGTWGDQLRPSADQLIDFVHRAFAALQRETATLVRAASIAELRVTDELRGAGPGTIIDGCVYRGNEKCRKDDRCQFPSRCKREDSK